MMADKNIIKKYNGNGKPERDLQQHYGQDVDELARRQPQGSKRDSDELCVDLAPNRGEL